MAQDKQYQFPDGFLWGAAISAHQTEGGNHNQWTIWELENAKSLAKQAEYKLSDLPSWPEIKAEATKPSNYVSGKAVDHYNRYETDFDLLTQMNMNAFRFSIEWSRIEPEEGRWNQKAIDHYRAYLLALRRRGIEPVVTLFHWSLPVWFAEKGGFEKRSNINYFVNFAEKVLDEFGEHMELICTLNEPENYVYYGWIAEGEWPPSKHGQYLLGAWVYANLATAHNRVARMIRRKSPDHKVGLSKSFGHYTVAEGKGKAISRLAVAASYLVADDIFLRMTRRRLDWLGVQYYMSFEYHGLRRESPEAPMNDLGWKMQPDDLYPVMARLWRRHHVPIIVTETGVADRSDRYRRWWLAHSMHAVHQAVQDGVEIGGYLYWSLLDNFEWAYGKWPRFGLVEVDYKTYQRTLRPSAIWFGKVIKKMRG